MMSSCPSELSLRQQCRLLAVNRSTILYTPKGYRDDTVLANQIAEIYQQYPVYGYRRLWAMLRRISPDSSVNPKRVYRVMKQLGLRAIYPRPRTTVPDLQAKIYPYLLKDKAITQPHQAWQTDITYLRTPHGFMYLNALMDVYSRYIVGWSLSNTLDAGSCLRSLNHALQDHPSPQLINTDQGCQYTSQEWITTLKGAHIDISMSGIGHSNDNAYVERLWRTIKYEGLVLYPAQTIIQLKASLRLIIAWYNEERPHSSLGYHTPGQVIRQAMLAKEEYAEGYGSNACQSPIPFKAPTTKDGTLLLIS